MSGYVRNAYGELTECPDYWAAKREGERAYESDRYCNPYRGLCEDAARAWDYGRRQAEYRHEEEIEERRAYERALFRQREEQAMWEAAMEQSRIEEDQARLVGPEQSE